jgi:membrane associated rhomboid family serine protease
MNPAAPPSPDGPAAAPLPAPPPPPFSPLQPPAPPPLTVAALLARITPVAWVTPAIVGLVGAGFVFELVRGASFDHPTVQSLLDVGADFGPFVVDGQPWRVVASMFLHMGFLHLLFNVWALWSGGRFTERIFGNGAYAALYVLAGVGGSLTSLAAHPMTVSVGASGPSSESTALCSPSC